jgi:xylulokinase
MNILAIDLGTGALKAVVFDEKLTVLGRASAPVPTRRDRPGEAVQYAQDWVAAMAAAVPQALRGSPRIDAITLTGHMSAPVFTAPDLQPLAPVQTLADTLSAPFVTDTPKTARITGNRDAAYFGRAKIARALAHDPALEAHGTLVLAPKDYLRCILGGSRVTDPSDAGNLLLVDPVTNDWSARLVAEAGLPPHLLPPILPSPTQDRGLSSEWAARFGLLTGTPLITGAADMATAALAGRVAVPGRVLVTIGTSATCLVEASAPPAALLGRFTFHTDGGGGGFVLGSHFNGGSCLDWFHALGGGMPETRDASLAALSRQAEDRAPSSDDPLFLSALLGAGSPNFDSAERGGFLRLSASHDRVDLFRSILEGISLDLAHSLSVLRQSGFKIDHVLAGGGGMRLSIWPQLLADATGCEVKQAPTGDASAEGAAILALHALGHPVPPERDPRLINVPEPARHAHYRKRALDRERIRQFLGTVASQSKTCLQED